MLDFIDLLGDSLMGGAFVNAWLKKKPWFEDHPTITKIISFFLFIIMCLTIAIIGFNIYRLLF